MKKALVKLFFAILCVSSLTQCKKDESDEFELIQIIKSITPEQMRALPVGVTKPVEVKKTGKIYIYNDLLFINEPNKGIHVYNNTNPNLPVGIAFVQIPGNVDLAIKDNILYADSYIDLLAFDISSINNITQVKRIKDTFKQFLTGGGTQRWIYTYKDTLVKKIKDGIIGPHFNSTSASSSSGQGGSMARFTLMNSYLYAVGADDLSLFDVTTASNPTFVKAIAVGRGVETIFPYENKLFIGTNLGMHIFNATDGANPVRLSTYAHIFACDPVVVQGKYAYVTLRTGTSCRQGVNQLEIIDIEDPTQPKQIAAFSMQNPHGLSISGNNLFLCEGDFGIKSFSLSDKNKIGTNMLHQLKNIKSFDVIAGSKSLIVTGDDGVYQLDYSNPSNLKQMSVIKIQTSSARNL